MVVYILNCEGKPLMPCSPRKARKLLGSGEAKVASRTPFVLKLNYPCRNRVQEVTAGMDTGSKVVGTAVITNGNVVFQGETLLRGEEIKRKMEQRSMYRRTRRSRLRYRKPRFLNHCASTRLNRLPPSVRHKVQAHLREKNFIESILPVTKWFVETASFDIHKISDPTVSKKDGKSYQRGQQLGFYNTKAFVLTRDQHTCQKCKKSKEGTKLHVHHIVFKSKGGTDAPNNLITLCDGCHTKLHAHKNAEKESLKLQVVAKKNTKHATEISILKSQLLKSDWEFEETFGYITKINREGLKMTKTHYNDAVCIAGQGEVLFPMSSYSIRRLVSKGDYQQTKGPRSEKRIPTGKIHGLRKFDLVYSKTKKILGFVKGKRSSGYFAISDILGKAIHNSINVRKDCRRLSARKLILTQKMETHRE
jgi:hypothetical protein